MTAPPSPPTSFRGWVRPGPVPPGGFEPEEGEVLSYICGNWKLFQYADGHRFSTDDVLVGWYGTTCAPRVARAADLGSGIGSVAHVVAWRCPGATLVTVEAQEISLRLARKSVRHNGLEGRVTLRHGDLRDPELLGGEEPFDLVTGSPPYFPPGTATPAAHEQAIGARIEIRGTVADYAAAATRILAPGGLFAFVFPARDGERARTAVEEAGLVLLRRRDVVFKEGEGVFLSLFAAVRREDVPDSLLGNPGFPAIEAPLVVRDANGKVTPEYAAVRMAFGFPPGEVGGNAGR